MRFLMRPDGKFQNLDSKIGGPWPLGEGGLEGPGPLDLFAVDFVWRSFVAR